MKGVKRKRPPAFLDQQPRRLGVWRRGGSVYVSLNGDVIRNKDIAKSVAETDHQLLALSGNIIQAPPVPNSAALTDWGLPQSVAAAFSRQGISSLYEWQQQCLSQILQRNFSSLIYSAPTSGGKSLVADVLLARRLLFEGKRALIVCPFVSICKERAHFLRSVLGACGVVVEEFHGPVGKPWHPGVDIAVCTVQKATAILHRILNREQDESEMDSQPLSGESDDAGADPQFSDQIGTVVVDEFHLACERRASGMETFVSRLGLLPDRDKIVLVGMSATLPQGKERAVVNWLGSHSRNGQASVCMYKCNFRPVELTVSVKRGTVVSRVDAVADGVAGTGCGQREVNVLFDPRTDSDFFGSLVAESVQSGNCTIIFCATRNWCENACAMLTRLFATEKTTMDQRTFSSRLEVIEALKLLAPCGVNPILAESVMAGIAFHHAGLTTEERTIVEQAFRTKTVLILCATSTLSAGVNLPAERVILRTVSAATGGMNPGASLPSQAVAKMKQMVGRAGRAGQATKGEAIVMTSNPKEEIIVREVFANGQTDTQQQDSCQDEAVDVKLVAKEILETIVFLKRTRVEYFLREFSRSKLATPAEAVRDAIQFLLKQKLVTMVEHGASAALMPSLIGDALAHSALPPDEAEDVFRELNLARTKLCLSGDDIHLLFLVTPPISVSESEFDEFTATSDLLQTKEVRTILGDVDTAARRKRMMVALMLRDLVSQSASIGQVASKYKVQTGTVQFLQSNAATYCAMVSSFCERLMWTSLAAALNSIKPRLHFGVPDELLVLVEIEGVSPARARALAKAGLTSVRKIAKSKPMELAIILSRNAESSETAQRLLDLTSCMIINNARIKLGRSDMVTASSSDCNSPQRGYDDILFPSISPPILVQLIGTQRNEFSDEDEWPLTSDFAPPSSPPRMDFTADPGAPVSGRENVGNRNTQAPLKKVRWSQAQGRASLTPIQESQAAEWNADFPAAPLEGIDDETLVSALDVIDTAPRRRKRMSEMTTIDARELRREFDIPSNNTGPGEDEQFEDANLDSAILKAINFSGF